ncbi:MAG: hypothetical protein ACRD6X_08625 [Pyrinomonadaceae bacterium]
MMELNLSGIVGAFIFLFTIGLVALICLITLIVSIFKPDVPPTSISRQGSFNYFLTSLLILIVDLLILAVFTSEKRVFTETQGESFDWWMLFVWSPIHFVGFFCLVWFIKRMRTQQKK